LKRKKTEEDEGHEMPRAARTNARENQSRGRIARGNARTQLEVEMQELQVEANRDQQLKLKQIAMDSAIQKKERQRRNA